MSSDSYDYYYNRNRPIKPIKKYLPMYIYRCTAAVSIGVKTGFDVVLIKYCSYHFSYHCSSVTAGHIQVFDSMYDDVTTDTVNQICSIVRSKHSKIKIEIMDVCKQKGTNDCGVYAIANATALCAGELHYNKYHIYI